MTQKFKTETKWVAISGAPCSGKTSVLKDLQSRGYKTVSETARLVLDREIAKGRAIEDIRRDKARLQLEILAENKRRDAAFDPQELVFFDRGMPDSIAYFVLAGLDPAPAVEAAREFKYHAVFLLDRLPFINDGVRTETEETAGLLDTMIENDYAALGYDPIRIPVLQVAARTDLILGALAPILKKLRAV